MPGKLVRLEHTFPEDLQSHFISNIIVQHQPEAFILSFFEIWPPPILGDSDAEIRRQADSIEEIEAKCVARLVVTPSKMEELIKAMTDNLQTYREMMRALAIETTGEDA